MFSFVMVRVMRTIFFVSEALAGRKF